MEFYHIYNFGIAILFYAIFYRIPGFIHCAKLVDAIGNVNDTSHKLSAREYFVYYQGVQGRPGVDFPVFTRIPRTTFSCKEVESGYYADLETDCQVFHICNEGTKVSFLCPNGTIFQQSDLICDWWFKVNCTNSPNLYEESAEQLRESLIRRKASRRVLGNRGESGEYQNAAVRPNIITSKLSRNNHNVQNNQSHTVRQNTSLRYPANNGVVLNDHRLGRNRQIIAVDNSGSDEMQITQETASFVSDYNKKVMNPYPNHRATYSEIRDPKTFYTSVPSNTLNNGKPYVVSSPKVGTYTTEKAPKYSPTVPPIRKYNYITALPISTSTKKYMSNYGERIRQVNMFTSAASNSLPKKYSNVETFTHPPSVVNGKATVTNKPKTKQSFTIALNSVQGSVPFKMYSSTAAPLRSNSNLNKDTIKVTLSSGEPAKQITQKIPKPRILLDTPQVAPKLKLSLDNELPSITHQSSPNGFYVTKSALHSAPESNNFQAGSITGSHNTYIPTTSTETTTFAYFSNTFGFIKPTGMPKPKPFELLPTSTERIATTTLEYPDGSTYIPNYQISSASPFTHQPSLLPPYNTPQLSLPPHISPEVHLPENVGNMLHTLHEIANLRFSKSKEETHNKGKRPGLFVPPAAGPQTLHTLAVYFANALDSLVEENRTSSEDEVTTIKQIADGSHDNTVINSLLSRDTIRKYKELFNLMAEEKMLKLSEPANMETEETEEDREDLQTDHSNNAVQSPRVRQLAKVFSQALSSYLDDPQSFKMILHQIRPTEPPALNTEPTDVPNDEDELLNFSDADIKPEHPRLSTPAPSNLTWGYLLAYNTTDFKSNHIDHNDENLQSADSQNFVTGLNNIISNRNDKSLKLNSSLPNNHWTSSPDVTKLWQTTLYVNPLHINQNFDLSTEPLVSSSTEELAGFEQETTGPNSDSLNHPVDLTEFNTESHIDYEVRSIPKIELNSTSVHGLLIDFMNSSSKQGEGRLQRLLRKLNTTQDEFLNKMKEIEQNPLTRRLILLLVSECGNLTDAKSHAVRDIINLARKGEIQGRLLPKSNNSKAESLEPESIQSPGTQRQQRTRHFNDLPNTVPPRMWRMPQNKLIYPGISENEQDSRALQLLHSLYNIASKYGK